MLGSRLQTRPASRRASRRVAEMVALDEDLGDLHRVSVIEEPRLHWWQVWETLSLLDSQWIHSFVEQTSALPA
jgi:hypothetical protein